MQRRRFLDAASNEIEAPVFALDELDHAMPAGFRSEAPPAAPPSAAAGPDATWMRMMAAPTDTLLSSQWAVNTSAGPNSINVQSVWTEYRGAGIKVAVVDDGFDYNHFDLRTNYDRNADQDLIMWDGDAINQSGNNHGTAVMGVIGADNNGQGTVGIAPDATLLGYRIGYGAAGGFDQLTYAMQYGARADVVNNSWSYTAAFSDNFDISYMHNAETAIIGGVSTGRAGLGSNYVFAAGNGRQSGEDVNHHSFQNSIFTTSVAATDANGVVAHFSTPGAAVHVAAPGVSILTTDASNGGYNGGDSVWMNGTSFAAPAVSGVVALMLEANKGLAYRDVQELLAYSARITDSTRASWTTNDADNWNGGGLHTSTDYGFGLVNAHDAVRLAETWTLKSTYATMDVGTAYAAPGQSIPGQGTIYSNLAITRAMDVDKVEIELRLSHDWIGDLRVSLVSPGGTESILINRPGVVRDQSGAGSSMDNINFSLTSNQFWGEDSVGTWQLKVEDLGTGGSGRLDSWRLNVFGDDVTYNDQYVFTDEFARYGSDAARRQLVDTRGLDTVNASAVTGNVSFDLRSGGTIAGQQVKIQAGSLIERLYTGDGNDVLIGNSAANSIWAGRGNDVQTGGAGADRFLFGRNSGSDAITDFMSDDKIVLRDGIWARSFAGNVATLSDGATVTAANGYLWKTTDFIFG